MPKRGVNTAQCEIFRFYKLHATGNVCEPISMIVPRKSTLFQSKPNCVTVWMQKSYQILFNLFPDDIYPDTVSDTPATTAKEWLQGRNVQPIMLSMQTGQLVELVNKNKQNQQQNGINNRKLMNDSNYNINNNNHLNNVNGNGHNKNKENDHKKCDNNTKKFAFLAQQTIPDYRPQVNEHRSIVNHYSNSNRFVYIPNVFLYVSWRRRSRRKTKRHPTIKAPNSISCKRYSAIKVRISKILLICRTI